MFRDAQAMSGFSVDDIDAARRFYGETLGLEVTDGGMGTLEITVGDGTKVLAYPKENHQPATYTMLNFVVPDIEQAVDDLTSAGVEMERYEGFPQDAKGISRDEYGPAIAWFTDPAGNVIAVMQLPA
jgi:catechol 2,3-dioxygenase-like lactoylglutathione lyase family enzyme